ncbi:MAG: peptidoglycan D,D-transpeptidase FtsI family protein [Trueperaceae bacterium]
MIAKIRTLVAIVFTVLVIFAGRLVYLQVVLADDMRALSEQNVRVEKRLSPLRGKILARDGTILADNRIAWDLRYWGGEIKNWDKLAFLLKLKEKPLGPEYSDPEQAQFGSIAAYNIPDDLVSAVEELVAGQENLYLRERLERTYPTNLAAQVVGYTQESKGRFPNYALNENVGVMGIEESYQTELFGLPGKVRVHVDNHNTPLSQDIIVDAQPGEDIILTLDPNVQRIAEDALKNALPYVNDARAKRNLPPEEIVRGALVAMNPKTGEILAMASAPTFDQNIFTRRPSDPKKVSALLNDNTNLPMSNRSLEAFPPASTFKLITSSTLVEGGFVRPEDRFSCSAYMTYGGRQWKNWSYPSHRGNYDTIDAIADSCNTYYWRAVMSTPNFQNGWADFAEALVGRAREFGFGEPVGIGLIEEKAGRVPDDTWSRDYHDYAWRPGDTLNISIGQGDALATPIQDLQMVSTIALNGRQVKPHLVKAVGDVIAEVPEKQIAGVYWDVLKTGMRHMITDYGSARYLGPSAFPITVAGKTGTAQNAKSYTQDGYDHVWFTGFAPMEDPEIAVVVFVEHGDKSTAVAVPTARDFLKAYFELQDEPAVTASN